MVTDTAAEVAEALGVASEELAAMQPQSMPDGVPGGGMFTYQVSDPDKESWRPAWRLEKGRDGLEYGKPMKLPKDPQALARYLAKKRLDGGRLFTLTMPARIAPQGQFECFVAPESCKKKSPTKGALLDHMEGCHPAESRHYAPFIKEIRDSIAAENPALAKMSSRWPLRPTTAPLLCRKPCVPSTTRPCRRFRRLPRPSRSASRTIAWSQDATGSRSRARSGWTSPSSCTSRSSTLRQTQNSRRLPQRRSSRCFQSK